MTWTQGQILMSAFLILLVIGGIGLAYLGERRGWWT